MNIKIIKATCQKLDTLYEERLQEIALLASQNNVGGTIRQMTGSLGEAISQCAWSEIGNYYAHSMGVKFESLKGDRKKIKCINEMGHCIEMQVDRHQYINDKLVHIEECKAYLDRCYLIRASDDCRMIKKYYTHNEISSSVLAIEDSIKKESYEFIMDEANISNVFFLTDGKRNSQKPIWKSAHFKPLNKEKVKEYVISITRVFEKWEENSGMAK